MGIRLIKLLLATALPLISSHARGNICQYLTVEGQWRSGSIRADQVLELIRESIRDAVENPDKTLENADVMASKVVEAGEVERIASITPFRLAIRAVKTLYRSIPGRLERRYGRTQAKIIMGALVVSNTILLPIPGSSLMVGLPPVLLAETYFQVRKLWGRQAAMLASDGDLIDRNFRRLSEDELVEAVIGLRVEIQRTWFEKAGWQDPQ